MRSSRIFCGALLGLLIGPLAAQSAMLDHTVWYTQDFETDVTGKWNVHSGPGINSADFFFDYSTVGIPPAPSGPGTRGLKLQANLNPNIAAGLAGPPIASSPNGTYAPGGTFGGITVSPDVVSPSFLFYDVRLAFDWWANYNGPVGGGGNGTTQVSQFGIGTAGTSTQWIGSSPKDSVFFAATLDGGSAADFRAYSTAAPTSYGAGNAVYQAPGGAINNTDPYYATPFPAGATAPAAQLSSYPLQTGATAAGVTGFRWNKVEIFYAGGFASWSVNGTPIARVDLATVTLGGRSILFGHSDTNAAASIDETHPELLFTLIDNVRIEIDPTGHSGFPWENLKLLGDLNEDQFVDAADYVIWRQNGYTQEVYDVWRANFGRFIEFEGSTSAVPEPGAMLLALMASIAVMVHKPKKGSELFN